VFYFFNCLTFFCWFNIKNNFRYYIFSIGKLRVEPLLFLFQSPGLFFLLYWYLLYCKSTLGVKKSFTNLAVRAELGQLLLESFIKTQTSLYLLRLNNDNINPLLKEAVHLSKKPRWTFSIAVLSIRFNSSISELLFNQINRCIGDNHICEKWKQKKYLNILKNFFSCQFLKVVHTHSLIHCMVKAGTHQWFGVKIYTCILRYNW
jgi:hypothetical protein